MNAFSVLLKILAAAAVIAGIVYVVIVYGDKQAHRNGRDTSE